MTDMWIPNRWQENLLWHLLRTGDWFADINKRPDYDGSIARLIIGGSRDDLKKLYAIKEILGGAVTSTNDYGPWEYQWIAREHTERYLRWFEDKWENYNIICGMPSRRRWVKECLEAIDED